MGGDTDYSKQSIAMIEYILAQKHIDTSILKSTTHLYIGIGCACSIENGYLCYIVTAEEAVSNVISEKIPYFQDFIPDGFSGVCEGWCPFADSNTAPVQGEFYSNEFCTLESLQDQNDTPDQRC